MTAGPVSGCQGVRCAVFATGACLLLSPLVVSDARPAAQSKPASGWTKSVAPAAQCGPGERSETGLQGQTTMAERFAPGPTRPYNCNLEVVGQFEGEGAQFDLTTLDTCGYFSTA